MSARNTLAWLLAFVAGAACGWAQAQGYPTKPVRFIVTYPPGGSSEVMARIIGRQLSEYWKQPILVEPRPGADGSIGMEYASRQPADGYTFLHVNINNAFNDLLAPTPAADSTRSSCRSRA